MLLCPGTARSGPGLGSYSDLDHSEVTAEHNLEDPVLRRSYPFFLSLADY